MKLVFAIFTHSSINQKTLNAYLLEVWWIIFSPHIMLLLLFSGHERARVRCDGLPVWPEVPVV